jgi:hypothetical protein
MSENKLAEQDNNDDDDGENMSMFGDIGMDGDSSPEKKQKIKLIKLPN